MRKNILICNGYEYKMSETNDECAIVQFNKIHNIDSILVKPPVQAHNHMTRPLFDGLRETS